MKLWIYDVSLVIWDEEQLYETEPNDSNSHPSTKRTRAWSLTSHPSLSIAAPRPRPSIPQRTGSPGQGVLKGDDRESNSRAPAPQEHRELEHLQNQLPFLWLCSWLSWLVCLSALWPVVCAEFQAAHNSCDATLVMNMQHVKSHIHYELLGYVTSRFQASGESAPEPPLSLDAAVFPLNQLKVCFCANSAPLLFLLQLLIKLL